MRTPLLRMKVYTASQVYDEKDRFTYQLREDREAKIDEEDISTRPLDYYRKKGWFYPEFWKVIGVALYSKKYVFLEGDEKDILLRMRDILKANKLKLAGHNINFFDIPFLFKRMIAHKITPPSILNLEGKKPREIDNIDWVEKWKNGSFGASIPLIVYTVIGDKLYIERGDRNNLYYHWDGCIANKHRVEGEQILRASADAYEEYQNIVYPIKTE